MTNTEWLLLSEMTVATALNVIATIEEKKDPVPPLVASGAFTLGLLFFADFNDDLARAFAAVFLSSTLILRYKVWGPILTYLGGNSKEA